ncbi:MAG: hypothetical protein M0R49_08090 [Limnochordia bacterium]|nr:hypothetical protein [Limnochordia bacterium]
MNPYSTLGKLSYQDQAKLRAIRKWDTFCTPHRIDWTLTIAGIAAVMMACWGVM